MTASDEEVRELHVAMNDADAVGLGQGLARLHHVLDGLGHGDRSALLRERGEIAAVEVLHDDVRLAGLERADVEHLGDVLVAQAHHRLRLAEKAAGRFGLVGDAATPPQELHRDELIELQVSRSDDVAHASAPKHALDAVLARENVAGLDGGHRLQVYGEVGGPATKREGFR